MTRTRLLSSRLAALGLLLLAAITWAPSAARAAGPPDIRHVWTIVLENKDYEDSFGPDTEAPYLARELTARGKLLTNYHGTSHASLGNYLTLVSGQAVNVVTQADCAIFSDIFPGTRTPDGQTLGAGCVFPRSVRTIADQLQERGLRWRGYMEDMGNTPGQPPTCRHPRIGAVDDTQAARAGDQYATRHNPFVYFHSIIDDPARCAEHVVPLDRLEQDIARPQTTPNYAFITPDLCNDGHDASCVDGGLGGLPAADAFLRRWVPKILASPGFAQHGMLIITWDEANIDPDSSTACCGEPTGPNTLAPGLLGPGGGRTGSVVLSPFVQPGSRTDTPYNHYALLRSVEDVFGLDHLGYAAMPGLRAFGEDVYDRTAPAPVPAGPPRCVSARSGRVVAAARLRPSARGVLLTFRARRTARVRITVTHRSGRRVTLRRLTRVRACRAYQVRLPDDVVRARVVGAGRTVAVARTASAEHDEEAEGAAS
ncbi:alkaline phosphatase family protein [Paraconexibacter algicola]|uniref:alkaline phosphatase family protein n=1 Tax=Paraconexibacter algicola TaxID=2133960 RepID=UPI0018EEBD0C|nr:alkaline phosphatase family protein [Paraconexibacter algicola]